MATRSRTRSGAASVSALKPPSANHTAKTTQARKKTVLTQNQTDAANQIQKSSKGKAKAVVEVHCMCRKGDDGSPMVYCIECKDWYHFSCVKLSEQEADDINVYICPSCTEKTGRRTVFNWEGLEAFEDDNGLPISTRDKPPRKPPTIKAEPAEIPSESEEDPSSADEYVADNAKLKGKGVPVGKRRTRRLSFSSESDSSTSVDGERKPRRGGSKSSTSPSRHLKRKPSGTSYHTSKKAKHSESQATDDPARKYCLGKLEEVFRDIFLRYPHVRVDPESGEEGTGPGFVNKKLEELSEEEKGKLLDEAKQFAIELEQCMYDIYSEPDKLGIPSAAGKYKDRFRMVQFNLSKVDRVVIHQRIASALITPKEISLMSSTDLANEETKQSIRIAEKEALEHSILQKKTAPRAKITHKGLEDIEDIHGETSGSRSHERDLESGEEERRERERMARLRAVESQPRQRTASISVPPESPIQTYHNPTWGAPPPVPVHAQQLGDSSTTMFSNDGQPSSALYIQTESTMEPEMNLADLINIDDEPSGHSARVSEPPPSPAVPETPSENEGSPSQTAPLSAMSPPTGISPFAAKSQHHHTSFDLNALWTAPTISASESPPPQSPSANEERKDAVDVEEADDQDFDMFLEEKDQDVVAVTPESLQAAFDARPQVWSGKINMPLDSTIPQETPVVARQMGGRSLSHDSPLWRTLFPSDLLRIDGRVPVANSCKFLLQMRMNVAKELIAVAFSPGSAVGDAGFRILTDFLIAKGRHGLVFPWGTRPKDYHPGRELYIIPLLSSDPLPDYMELLDELHLPNVRKVNYLIGIWVLNKGKLAPPPAPVIQPSIPSSMSHPLLNISLPAPQVPPQVNAPGLIPRPIEPAALAAEVASLTPEQIQMMIRTLASAAPLALAPSLQQPINASPPHPYPPMQPSLPPPPPPQTQPWMNPTPGFSGGYPPNNSNGQPPLNMRPPPPPPPHHAPLSPYTQPPYERRDYGHDSRQGQGQGHDRGDRDRGDRNRRGRGRGRGRGREGNESPHKPLDSGWPRRPRSDGRGGGPSSPAQQRWG